MDNNLESTSNGQNSNTKVWIVVGVIVALVVGFSVGYFMKSDSSSEIDDLQNQIDTLVTKNSQLQNQIDKLENDNQVIVDNDNETDDSNGDLSEEEYINKTALLSFREFFCYGTESSSPFAYFQFAYQDNGDIKYIKTKTTCEDLIKINATNNPTIFGEQINLQFKGVAPIKIIRENGNIYEIEGSEKIRNFFTSTINVYDNNRYFNNSNSDKIISECLLIINNNQHDRCLSYQAAFLQDKSICNDMNIVSNKNLCEQWVDNILNDKINQ